MFFLLPVGVDYRARRYPVVTFTLMGVCALVYVITLTMGALGNDEEVDQWVYEHLWLTPNKCYWWTFITCQFVHGGFWHIAGNMVYLFLFGSCVEDMIGRIDFTIFYLLCGIVADFSHILLSPEHFASEIPMGGASGAISGCIGGFLILLAKSKIEFRWVIFLFFRFWSGVFMLPAWLVISFWFLDDFTSLILDRADKSGGSGVAFGAHVGGTLGGMGLIALEKIRFKRTGGFNPPEEEEKEEPEPAPVTRSYATPRVRPQLQAAPVAPVETPTIFLSWDGANYGPYAPSQILSLFKRGQIPDHATYWQQGMEDWRTAEELRPPRHRLIPAWYYALSRICYEHEFCPCL